MMEPKLMMYRIMMAVGCVGFILSLSENYFPKGWICIASAIFTAVYLWEELMCSNPSRKTARYEEPGPLGEVDPTFHYRRNPELFKFFLFLAMPFIVWHIMSFGTGYMFHKMTSQPAIKELVISPVIESKGKGRHSYKAMKIKNMKTYALFAIPLPEDEYEKVKFMRDVTVEIDVKKSIFGLSFPDNFAFKSIKKE